jgi:hypothetical protein
VQAILNTNQTNEDQRVPARPVADQQNTKDNSCHTPRTKAAAGKRRIFTPREYIASRQLVLPCFQNLAPFHVRTMPTLKAKAPYRVRSRHIRYLWPNSDTRRRRRTFIL